MLFTEYPLAMLPQVIVLLIVAAYTATGCVWDIKTRKLPNWLTVPTFALGLLFHTVVGGLGGLQFSLAGFAVGFGLLFVLMAVGGGGGGDVKFMGALGAWVGWKAILVIFIGSGLIAAISLLALLAWGLISGKSAAKGGPEEAPSAARRLIPYALPATVSAWLVLGGMFTLKWIASS